MKLEASHHIILTIFFSFFFFLSSFVFAQDFGFGFNDYDDESYSSSLQTSFNGEVTLEFPFYFKDYEFLWEELARAKLNYNISCGNFEAITSFNLSYNTISEIWDKDADWGKANHTPLFIDEAYLRAFIGPVNIEAGLRKLSWGRADSSGPLDVTNPVDFTDLRYITDIRARKIARPMLHVTWNAGNLSKLEGVFIPNFAPHRFASGGRWTPSQFSNLPIIAGEGILTRALEIAPTNITTIMQLYLTNFSDVSSIFPDTSSFNYFQGGLRYTTSINSIDVGAQYYYGNLFRPNFTIDGVDDFVTTTNLLLLSPQLKYTRYHQIGLDYAQVLYGFNTRAELALNLTEDINGSDGSLQNPFIAWSLGFDRDIGLGINLNLQCNETIRLFNSKVGSNPVFDCEAGTNVTNTRLTMRLSKTFLRDDLKTEATFIWDIENSDFYIIPSCTYTYRDFLFNITAGFFAGDKSGELGQYWNNNFVRLSASFIF